MFFPSWNFALRSLLLSKRNRRESIFARICTIMSSSQFENIGVHIRRESNNLRKSRTRGILSHQVGVMLFQQHVPRGRWMMPQATARKDFFISYTHADRTWAEWIAFQLEEAGYITILQAWDFRPGSNF